jgi:P-type E1-E2 ATPase
MRKILINTRVFARMNPSNKTNLVALLQENKLKVAMVGDGANDCGALKQAGTLIF